MYGNRLWPDLDLEPSLISNIYSISAFPYILGVFGVSFVQKLIILRSLRLVTLKQRFWPLTWAWPDTWPHSENLGGALRSSRRELSNAASLVSLRPFVHELWRGGATCPWGRHLFHHLLGGCLNTPTPRLSRLLRIVEQNGKRRLKAREKIISKSFRSFFGSGQNWGHQASKFQNFPKPILDGKIFHFKGRATILIPSCLSC